MLTGHGRSWFRLVLPQTSAFPFSFECFLSSYETWTLCLMRIHVQHVLDKC